MGKYESRKKLIHRPEYYGNDADKPNSHCIYANVDGKKGWYETESHMIQRLADRKIDRVHSANADAKKRIELYGGNISIVCSEIKKVLKKYALSHGISYKPNIIVLMSNNYYSSCCMSAYTLPSRFNEDYEFMHWQNVLGYPIIRCTSHLDKIGDFKIIVKDESQTQEFTESSRKIIDTVYRYFKEGICDSEKFSIMLKDLERVYKAQNNKYEFEKEEGN